jgi:UDP-2,3-diacylglucosamine pyrophosphatase LpxH
MITNIMANPRYDKTLFILGERFELWILERITHNIPQDIKNIKELIKTLSDSI